MLPAHLALNWVRPRARPVDTYDMGLMDRARDAAEQARAIAARPGQGDAEEAGKGSEPIGEPHHRSAFSVFADKLDPGTLADLVQKAGGMQEKVNATLRDRGLGYRISEVCFTATFPPQVSFYIASAPAPAVPPAAINELKSVPAPRAIKAAKPARPAAKPSGPQ